MTSMPVVLQAHPTARDTAVSETRVSAGTVLVAVPCLAQVLLGAEKGRRCDCCLTPEEAELRLRRCSGCGSYWYCDAQCQRAHWPVHKKYCSNLPRYTSSPAFAQLQTHQKLDAVLLTHLLAEFAATDTSNEELATFASLLPGPVSGLISSCPPTCPLTTSRKPSHSASELYRRCGNNNFVIHSHFTTIAHGIFPLASRLFNHSCLPNAFPKYTFDRQHRIQMSIVAMRDIEAGEQICISYVDPALLDTRQQIFQFTYGFTCTCPSCTALSIIRRTSSPPPISDADITSLSTRLVNHVFPRLSSSDLSIALPSTLPSLATLPPSLHVALHESFLTNLTDRFSSASHEGPFDVALESGLAVLALYVLIYPPNYPQIGLHLLELSKTAWNAHVTSPDLGPSTSITDPVHRARVCLDLAQQVLRIVGPEGDPGGPAKELEVLAGLLSGGDT